MSGSALEGRVALVTGASGGIGAAIVRRLSSEGARVALGYGHNREAAERLAESLAGDALVVGGDLSRAATARETVATVEESLGPVDVLVANAGIGRIKALEDIKEEDWNEAIAVNLTAPFLMAQAVAPEMRERGFGRILFMSSVAAFTGGIVGPHYAASKAGVNGLTHALASRLAADGITVNALAPALIEQTGMLPGSNEELRRRIPVGRLGRPEEVADLAIAVIANGYVSNEVIGIDGGAYPR
jgi:3-oxoacyl-[acyl-carrier protein] reductase